MVFQELIHFGEVFGDRDIPIGRPKQQNVELFVAVIVDHVGVVTA